MLFLIDDNRTRSLSNIRIILEQITTMLLLLKTDVKL